MKFFKDFDSVKEVRKLDIDPFNEEEWPEAPKVDDDITIVQNN